MEVIMLNTIANIVLILIIVLILFLQIRDAVITKNTMKLADIVYALVGKANKDMPDATGNEKYRQVLDWLKKCFPKQLRYASIEDINALIEQAVDFLKKTE